MLITYSVHIYQYKDSDKENLKDKKPIVSLCCDYCKMWDKCEQDNEKTKENTKSNICYIAKEVENKLIHLAFGFSYTRSGSDFMLKVANQKQEKSIDKVRKRLLKKYKMRQQ